MLQIGHLVADMSSSDIKDMARFRESFILIRVSCSSSNNFCFIGSSCSWVSCCKQCINSYVCDELKKTVCFATPFSSSTSYILSSPTPSLLLSKKGNASIRRVTQKYFGASRDHKSECSNVAALENSALLQSR